MSDSNVNKDTLTSQLPPIVKRPPTRTRETWTGRFDFFLTALGYAVGLGAVWRFPYLCYKNGGGAFLIPYFIFLFLVGIPLVFLEMAIGQFTSSGPMTCWVMSPVFRGLGFSFNTVNNYVNVYFTMILCYSLYFLVLSLTSVLPWQNCNPQWKQQNCVDNFDKAVFNFTLCDDPSGATLKCADGACYSALSAFNTRATCQMNRSLLVRLGYWNAAYPSQIFWQESVLERSAGIGESGHIVWQLLLGLFVAWLMVYAMVINGIKVSGKLVYFTSLFPYVVLLMLGVRGWMLEGAALGIKYYIYPDFSKLGNLRVWSDAASQIFFTLNVSYGGLLALSSYNNFKANILRDSITVSLANCATSVFAGFVVFPYIGYLSHITGQDIDKVVQAGQGLAFVVYPFAVTTIKGAPFWACMFFVMMLILGLDSTMGSIETFITSVFDLFPTLRAHRWKRYGSITLICCVFFMLGIIFSLQSGTYWLELFDSYAGGWAIFLVGALECISVGWFYGFDNFRNDLKAMLGERIVDHVAFNVFRLLWCFVTPAIVLALFVVAVINALNTSSLESSNGYIFPYWTTILGNLISASTLFGVFFWAVYFVVKNIFIDKRPLSFLFEADPRWRPRNDENKMLVEIAHGRLSSIDEKQRVGDIDLGLQNESFEIF